MTIKHVIALIVALILVGIYVAWAEPAHAQDGCNVFWDENTGDDLISDDTVPYPNVEHCDEHGMIRLVCNYVEVTAYETAYFYLVGDYDTEVSFEFYMAAGNSRSFSIPEGVEWLQLWYEWDIVGLVDIVSQDCSSDVAYPPDNRVNWQQGDSFFAAYVDNGYLSVYATGSGEGVLILLATSEEAPICSEDGTACLYLLEDGTYQLNLIDPEGKLYEVVIEW